MTPEQIELLKIAARAAHKLAVNRSVYRYDWMDKISTEVRELEEAAARLQTEVTRLQLEPSEK